jgi:P pilus assembly chaperone PapD
MKKLAVITVLLTVFLALALASPILAGGLSVSGGKIEATVNPGSNSTRTINVQNTSDAVMNIGVDVEGYGLSTGNDFVVLAPADDTGLFSARSWLAVSPSNFSLKPGDSQAVTVNLNIPAGAGSGGRYAIVMIQTIPAPGQQVATVSAVAARVILTVSGNSQDTTSQITAVDAPKSTGQATAGVMVTLANKGNYHYSPQIQATVKNGDKIVATGTITNPGWPILPGYSRQYQINLTGQEAIAAGKYQVDVTVKDDSGKAITSGTFPVTYGVKQAVLTTATSTGAAPASTAAAVTEPSKGTNLAIIVAAVAGVIIVVLLVFVVLLLRKRRI